MISYILRRLLQLLPVLLVASTAIWAIIYAVPGTPVGALVGENATQEQVQIQVRPQSRPQIRTQVVRISTLYGHASCSAKQQGLLTHMARSILRRKPIQIYVPYDTIRDYIAADDAATAMITTLRATGPAYPHAHLTRIIASQQPATIAEIIAIFNRVARRAPRIVTSASRLSDLYTRRIQFRSVVLQERPRPPVRSLLVGIAELMNAERDAFARASLP